MTSYMDDSFTKKDMISVVVVLKTWNLNRLNKKRNVQHFLCAKVFPEGPMALKVMDRIILHGILCFSQNMNEIFGS